MRLSELERWLYQHGWRMEPRKGGSMRAWQHPDYPGQRLTYHAPHRHDGAELRPDVVRHILKAIARMRTAEEGQEAS